MNKRARILLVEDDPNLGLVVQEHLQMNGFAVTLSVDGRAAIEAFAPSRFDLCLVDIMMPRMDGFTFAAEVRKQSESTPLIFLTARSLKEDKIKGFKLGCDDYITKPFSIEELLLRIEAVLKRSRSDNRTASATEFRLGRFRFDVPRQLLSDGDSQQKLTPKEAELLALLCRHRNQVLTREEALREVWQDDSYFTGRSMDVFISKLRKYLAGDSSVEILSVHGKGFRLIAPDSD